MTRTNILYTQRKIYDLNIIIDFMGFGGSNEIGDEVGPQLRVHLRVEVRVKCDKGVLCFMMYYTCSIDKAVYIMIYSDDIYLVIYRILYHVLHIVTRGGAGLEWDGASLPTSLTNFRNTDVGDQSTQFYDLPHGDVSSLT